MTSYELLALVSQIQQRYLGENFLYVIFFNFTLLCNDMGVGACAVWMCECGCELCMAFWYSVSLQQEVMLLHCRQERLLYMCWMSLYTLQAAMSVNLV